jgi:hypothetical protein
MFASLPGVLVVVVVPSSAVTVVDTARVLCVARSCPAIVNNNPSSFEPPLTTNLQGCRSDDPDEADDPDEPDGPYDPDEADDPDGPDDPDDPDEADDPDGPYDPDGPDDPDDPDGPDEAGRTGSSKSCRTFLQRSAAFPSRKVQRPKLYIHISIELFSLMRHCITSTIQSKPNQTNPTILYHTLHYTTLHHTLHYTTLHHTLHYTTHYTTLHYTTPHTTLHYTTPHYTTLHTTLHYTLHTAHCTLHTAHYNTMQYTLHTTRYTLHYTLQYNTLHYNTYLHFFGDWVNRSQPALNGSTTLCMYDK